MADRGLYPVPFAKACASKGLDVIDEDAAS